MKRALVNGKISRALRNRRQPGRPTLRHESLRWASTPMMKEFRCSKCDKLMVGPLEAENHLYFLHGIDRPRGRELIMKATTSG